MGGNGRRFFLRVVMKGILTQHCRPLVHGGPYYWLLSNYTYHLLELLP